MNSEVNVAVLVGSLRKESFSRKIAQALTGLAPATLRLELLELSQLAMYNADLDEDQPPAAWVAFRKAVAAADAVLFVTPEYNRSVPGVLKNALDVASRPSGRSVWNGKPGAVISVSPGAMAAFGANHHLRQSLVFLNVPAMQQPEAYLGRVDTLLDATGHVTNEGTRSFLAGFLQAFAAWIEANRKA
jgi:chromate reductase